MFNDVAEFISLTMTVPTLCLSAWVVLVYGREAWESVKQLCRLEPVSNTQLLIAGITIGFFGAFFDNAYWGLAWTADFFGLDSRDWLFQGGVYSNIPFRQGAGVLAASLHVLAAVKESKTGRRLYLLIWALTGAAGLALARAWAMR